ncbi:glycosyltransferase family 2 protein [Clostridium perfringens]|uniref:glycosyltransferase family 2 protein n=1 Tax=Clostridium perfringens TaxID=1502 RepID=UPI0022483639|nr:glycosyltransferase [Clostridium perfringens]MCX0368604.1 glycosyltransferase [Clostridium perfringens]
MLEKIVDFINLFFMYYIFIYAVIFFISTVYSIIDLYEFNLKKRFNSTINIYDKKNYTPISILVPAYNEEKTILKCIDSLLALEYPEYEIIIVNDGSKDKTLEVLINRFSLKKIQRPIRKSINCKKIIDIYEGIEKVNITLINKENGGKADALNIGINASTYPLFLTLDADSVLQRDSLSNIVVPFIENENTIAVGGNVKISNNVLLENGVVKKNRLPKKWLIIFQIIEYYRVFWTTRVWFNKFNGNLIISGAFGLFKKSSVINVGGYNSNSIGEDMELVMKLHSFNKKNENKYSIQYTPNAICWSQAPEKLKDLKSQRKRWHMGLMQSLVEHKYIFLNIKYGVVGVFSFLYYFIYEMLSCLIEVFGVVFLFISYFTGFINLKFFITFMCIYIFYSSLISISSIFSEEYFLNINLRIKDKIKLILFSFLEAFGYRQMCSIFRIVAIFKDRTKKNHWEKIERVSYLEQ